MKVLITGASGRLAGYVIHELADRHELVLTSRHKPPKDLSEYQWVLGDLTKFEDCQHMVKGVEAVQHIGAQPWPVDHPQHRARAEEQNIPFDTTFRTNLLGTYYLMQAAIEAKVCIVVMTGSSSALGHTWRISGTPFPIRKLPIDETHPCFPEDSYSFTKLTGELLLASYTRAYGIRTYVTRPAKIVPEEERRKMAANAKPTTTWTDEMWCWVGSEDVASAHRLLMEAADDLPPHDVYFLNSDDTTALEPSYELVKRLKPDLMPIFLESNIKGHQSFVSNNKIKRAVDWKHKTSWRKYL
jgi:nucleoside-diphosphate-sugar epimerase